MMTKSEFLEYLRQQIAEAGGQVAFAELHGFGQPYVSEVLNGRRDPAERLLNVLGFERVMMFQRKEEA